MTMPKKSKPKKVETRDASKYVWRELEGLTAILNFTGTAQKGVSAFELIPVEVKWGENKPKNEYGSEIFNAYGDRLEYMNESFELVTGHIIICATVSTWTGTFGSHDDIKVRYYGLTLKS